MGSVTRLKKRKKGLPGDIEEKETIQDRITRMSRQSISGRKNRSMIQCRLNEMTICDPFIPAMLSAGAPPPIYSTISTYDHDLLSAVVSTSTTDGPETASAVPRRRERHGDQAGS